MAPAHPSPPLPPSWDAWLTASLDRLAGAVRLRSLRPVHPGPDSARVLVPGAVWDAWMVDYGCGGVGGQGGEGARAAPLQAPRSLTLFSTNDYLGLSTHPTVRGAASSAASRVGCGTRSSGLVGGGYSVGHRELETALAALKGADECLLFGTGYAANTAVLGALARCVGGGGGGDMAARRDPSHPFLSSPPQLPVCLHFQRRPEPRLHS